MQSVKLNIGCGRDSNADYINLDVIPLPGVDVVHDLQDLPLPFDDDTFTEILCQDVLEHLDYPELMMELYRVLKRDGMLVVRVPHFTSRNNFIDPTHMRQFSIRTFEYFVKDSFLARKYGYHFGVFSKLSKARISFEKKVLLYNYIVETVINVHPLIQNLYEATCLCRFFPAENIELVLVK